MRLGRDLLDRPLPLYLLLAPLLTPLSALHGNGELAPRILSVPFVLTSWLLVLVVWVAFCLVTRNARRAAAITVVLVVTFLVDMLTDRLTSIVVPVVMWTAALAACVAFIRSSRDPRHFTASANLVFALTVAILAGQVAWRMLTASPHVKRDVQTSGLQAVQRAANRPDVYIFVLDGYGRRDVLERLYGYDDTFVSKLQANGFSVADRASSNYAQTGLSLASSLNLEYLPALLEGLPSDSDWRRPCQQLIENNRMFEMFRRAGYRIATFASEYAMLTFSGIDRQYGPPLPLTEFEYTFFGGGLLPRFAKLAGRPPALIPHWMRRRQVEWTLVRLSEGVVSEGGPPTLVFVHLLLPHPPFTFREDGSYRPTPVRSGLYDGDQWRDVAGGTGEDYRAGYVDNLRFLRARFAAVVERIIRSTNRPTAMLIEGDHGPGSGLFWDDAAASDMNERMGILLAARFPEPNATPLYPGTTSVNAARLLVNNVLGTNLPLLEDRAWFSTWTKPYRFLDVTERAHSPRNLAGK